MPSRVLHLVGFQGGVTRQAIEEVLHSLLGARGRGEIAFGDARIVERTARYVHDGVYRGRIHTGSDGLGLMLSFDSVAELDAYYSASAHAQIRRALFATFSGTIAGLYQRADREPDRAEEIYREIEREAARFIHREDIIIE